MFVNKEKYNSLLTQINDLINKCKTLEEDKSQCQETIKQLTEEVNQQTPECKVGAWCEGCKYRKVVPVDSFTNYESIWLNKSHAGFKQQNYIVYCGKHLHDICPEWEPKN